MEFVSRGTSATFLDQSSSSSDDEGGFSYKGFTFRPKKKRRNDAGRRIHNGKTYDSSLGITCHFCRQKTTRKHVYCRECVLALCGPCLQNRHGEVLEIEVADDNWLCPKCRGGCGRGCKNCCNCTFCRKKQGLKPPKFGAGELQKHGFDNVHDYLVYLETGESANAISARKLGKGWCSSFEKRFSKLQQENRKVSKETADEIDELPMGATIKCEDVDSLEISIRKTRRRAAMSNGSISEDSPSIRETHQTSDDKMFVDAVEIENPKPRKDTCCLDNAEKKGFTAANVKIAYSEPLNEEEKIDSPFPEQFRTQNKFLEKLEARLAKPFDPQELKDLWSAITCRKTVCKASETDSRMTSFPTQELGNSYIFHYPDFAQKYMATGEHELKLRLLRGFFFWLEHGTTPGSFKPWADGIEDEECLELGADCEVLGVQLNVDQEKHSSETLPKEGNEDDVKPDVKNLCTNAVASASERQSNLIFNWDEEDIKPKVDHQFVRQN